jgi:hypothetical protein
MAKLMLRESKGKGSSSKSSGTSGNKHSAQGRGRECSNGEGSGSSSCDLRSRRTTRPSLVEGQPRNVISASVAASTAIGLETATASPRWRSTLCKLKKTTSPHY